MLYITRAKITKIHDIAKKRGRNLTCSLSFLCKIKLILEEVLNGLVRNHLLIKDVCTSLRALYHLDYLCVSATIL